MTDFKKELMINSTKKFEKPHSSLPKDLLTAVIIALAVFGLLAFMALMWLASNL